MMLLAQTILFAALQAGAVAPTGGISDFEKLIQSGQYEQARLLLEAYVQSHPASWPAWYQLGYVDFRLHRLQASVEALSKSLVLNQQFAESHKILAFDLNILGHKDLAIQELEKAIRLDPHSAESYYELGRIYYDQGSYLKAVENLRQAEALAPKMVKVHHNLGLAYFAVGNTAKAEGQFQEGLRLNAQEAQPSAWPFIDYASFLNQRNEFARARDLLLASFKISDQWEQAFDELAKAYRGLNEPQLAIDALKHAIALNPRKPEYHYALSRLYSQTNQPAKAREELAQFEKTRQPPSAGRR